MMKFEVKNVFSDAVQFTAEIDCLEDDAAPKKRGLAVKWAYLAGANLSGANLSGANLEGADLAWANLSGVDLVGANLSGVNGLNDWVKCIQIETYAIAYTAEILQIGCEQHPIADWRNFDDRRIAEMEGKTALKFWDKYRDWIFQTIELCPAKTNGGKTMTLRGVTCAMTENLLTDQGAQS